MENIFYGWMVGLFSSIPICLFVLKIGPWLMGWRDVTYNIHWSDEVKAEQIVDQVWPVKKVLQ